ncbi:MAG: YpdA family putative bacillithiol disulfide reductase [Gemmatimonadales bacterium]|nr:YpdA family putative bacillithiol disulfide reductase [Gemmatimonadales bacterium]
MAPKRRAPKRTSGARSRGADVLPVAVIGAGPCGLAAAAAIERAGTPCIVFDRGCIVSSIASYPIYLTFFSTAEKIAIAGVPFPLAAEKPTRRDALAYYRSVVTHLGLQVRQYEPVEAVQRRRNAFVLRSRPAGGDAVQTEAQAIVVATGYFGTPNAIGVPGEALPHVSHLYREGHGAFQRDVVVVGGGNSAAESALDLWRSGARVTLVHFGPTFDKNIKPWVLPDLQNRLDDGSISVRWNTRVTAIEPGRVHLEGEDGPGILPAQHVFLMTGFTPNSELLESLGVGVDADSGIPAHDPRTMETTVPGVYIAGVLASGFDANKVFIENGRDHGALIAKALHRRRLERA